MIANAKDRFYTNLNYNKTGSSGSIISTSNTYSPEMIGGCLVSNSIDTYCSSSISDLISQRDLTIFFRFILTTLTTTGSGSYVNRPILISYGGGGSIGEFYIILDDDYLKIIISTSDGGGTTAGFYFMPRSQVLTNVEYTIAITYTSTLLQGYFNGIKKESLPSPPQLITSARTLRLNYTGFYNTGYKIGDVYVGRWKNEFSIKRMHYGFHPFN